MGHWHQLVQGHLFSEAPLFGAAMVASLVCVLWVGGGLAWLLHALVRRRRERNRFRALAAERGFDDEEIRHLWHISRYAGSADRAGVLTSAEFFDACVDEARRAAGNDLVAWPEYLSASRVRSLRRNFDRERRTRHSITNTREIEPNQPVRVRLDEGRTFDTFVLSVDDDQMHLALPDEVRLGSDFSQQSFSASFFRPNDARYEFHSTVLDKKPETDRAFLGAHTHVKRMQQRANVRVRHRSEMEFAVVDKITAETTGEQQEIPAPTRVGMLRDLSLSGVCFIGDTCCAKGSWLLLKLGMNGDVGALVLPGRVVRQTALTGTSNRHVQTSVQFGRLSAQQERRLSLLVATLQQQLIRRMLSRAEVTRQHSGEARPVPSHRRTREASVGAGSGKIVRPAATYVSSTPLVGTRGKMTEGAFRSTASSHKM